MLQRNTVLVSKLTTFGTSLLVDWQMGRWQDDMPQRAIQLRHIIEELGPAAVKVGASSHLLAFFGSNS